MEKKEAEKYFDKEWKAMKSFLKSFLNDEIQEDLHRFRVQVKKIKAFLILLDSTEDGPKLSAYLKPVQKVFKQAGEIRNAYMNLELCKAFHTGTDDFLEQQHYLMERAIWEFKLDGGRHLPKIKKAHKILRDEIRHVSDAHIAAFYKTQLQQAGDFFRELKFDKQLHRCRTQIKILIYNSKPVHTAINGEWNEAYLDHVQTAIGDWHDNELALMLFSGGEVKSRTLVVKLQQQQTTLKNNIAMLVDNFYHHATTYCRKTC